MVKLKSRDDRSTVECNEKFAAALIASGKYVRVYEPSNCPYCEDDRRFPGFEAGGFIQMENNGPIVRCPLCNRGGAK